MTAHKKKIVKMVQYFTALTKHNFKMYCSFTIDHKDFHHNGNSFKTAIPENYKMIAV